MRIGLNPAKRPDGRAFMAPPSVQFGKKYWLDSEFRDEGKDLDLISIGIVGEENGHEYYAESNEFDLAKAEAKPWLKQHVLPKLRPMAERKSLAQIAQDIMKFIGDDKHPEFWAKNGTYDNFVLCKLFGSLMEMRDKLGRVEFHDLNLLAKVAGYPVPPPKGDEEHNALADARWDKRYWHILMDSLKAEFPVIAQRLWGR